MTNKTTFLRAFNTHFFEFVDDIIRIFPENVDIQASRTSFDLLKRANPTAIVKSWSIYVYSPYKDVIDGGDIRFFFEKNYKDDLSILANANEIMNIIDTLREPIRSMGIANQETTMQYIQNLSKLSELYSQL